MKKKKKEIYINELIQLLILNYNVQQISRKRY